MLRAACLVARRSQAADGAALKLLSGALPSRLGPAAEASQLADEAARQQSRQPYSAWPGRPGDTPGNTHADEKWELLRSQGYDVNPCNSKLHPAVTEAGIVPESDEELSVQEAYTPESDCFGCGPTAAEGLHLRSFRIPGGLEANITLDKKYCAFPGIMNGGIVSALFDCHGNWTAAVALMDRGCLPKPPLTLTYELLVTFKEPTPPNEPLVLRSEIVRVRDKESSDVGSKATVQVDLSLYHSLGGHEKLLATATGIFKRLGALRAL